MSIVLDMAAALDYARKHSMHALLVARGDELLAQEYDAGFDPATPHPLYSGTKSFWGIAALAAQADGLLDVDEPVARTIAAWQSDPWKKRVTLRMLLSLTSGLPFGGLGARVPTYEEALEVPLRDEPGSTFTYSGIPLQVFGAVLARKLVPRSQTPYAYLIDRILGPAGVHVARWRVLRDGTQPLPTGAFLCASAWLAFGRFMLRERKRYAESLRASPVNTRYGLGWWLAQPPGERAYFYASGAGGQALYLVPALDVAVVHFAQSHSYRHDSFLQRLLSLHSAKRKNGRGAREYRKQ